MTPEQQEALNALPPKRRAFVLSYVGESAGNATDAARRAGYATPDPEGSRLLGNDRVITAIKAFRVEAESRAIATVEELRAMWTAIARGEIEDSGTTADGVVFSKPAALSTRMKASELLGKSQGAFLERVEHSGGAELRFVPIAATAEELREEARRELRKGGKR